MLIVGDKFKVDVEVHGLLFKFTMNYLDALNTRRMARAFHGAIRTMIDANGHPRAIKDQDQDLYYANLDALWSLLPALVHSLECKDLGRRLPDGTVEKVEQLTDAEGIAKFMRTLNFGDTLLWNLIVKYDQETTEAVKKLAKQPKE